MRIHTKPDSERHTGRDKYTHMFYFIFCFDCFVGFRRLLGKASKQGYNFVLFFVTKTFLSFSLCVASLAILFDPLSGRLGNLGVFVGGVFSLHLALAFFLYVKEVKNEGIRQERRTHSHKRNGWAWQSMVHHGNEIFVLSLCCMVCAKCALVGSERWLGFACEFLTNAETWTMGKGLTKSRFQPRDPLVCP